MNLVAGEQVKKEQWAPPEPEDGVTTVLTPPLSSEEREKRSQRLGKVLLQTVQGFKARVVRGVLTLLLPLAALVSCAAEYQWSVPMPGSASGERRAYLWIPPDCQRVRGLIIGLQNMLEKRMFEDPIIRAAAADSGLGIVWIAPGSEGKGTPLDQDFSPRGEAVTVLQQTLDALAQESGYDEVAQAPLLAAGHSAATPFVWGLAEWNPARVFAIIPIKGWYPEHAPAGVPVFHIAQEWTEWGGQWGEDWIRRERSEAMRLRAEGEQALVGEFLDAGAGHFDWTPESAKVTALFIRKAAQTRLPENAPRGQPVALKPVDFKSGALLDALKLGTPAGQAQPVRDWQGDVSRALWYFDRELADAVNQYALDRLSKPPQVIDFVVDGQPAPLVDNGFVEFHPRLEDDGITFKVAATYLAKSPATNLFGGGETGHGSGPIRFRVGSGGLRQTRPDTFQVALDRGGVVRQGPPWEPWVLAYEPGGDLFRPADRPAHILIALQLTNGRPQTITFPEIPNQPAGVKSLKLAAIADSGLPVQYFVVSGPVELRGDTLEFTAIPLRARFPIRVTVAAFQWGRGNEPRWRSAGPIQRTFLITNGGFVHPGLLQGAEDFERIRHAISAHEEPVFMAFEQFRKEPQSQSQYVMRGPREMVGRNPTVGEAEYDSDANAAYQCALMWAITGERAFAEKSQEIINGWSRQLKAITGRDAVLMAGLGPFKMVNAAEIIRHTGAGWPAADVRQAEKHFREVIHPVLRDFAPFANGNWDTAAMKTEMAIAVFCNDGELFERAVRYYVNGPGDGSLRHYIINDTGQCQESGRDQQHTQLGLAHLADGCEIAWHQGLDLYDYDNNRLLKGFEYTAKYNLGEPVPFAEALDRTGQYHQTSISPEGRGKLRPIYEEVLNHYVHCAGLAAPNVLKAVRQIRPEGPGLPGADHMGFGTLLYAGAPATNGLRADRAPCAPAGLTAIGNTAEIKLAWVAPRGAARYRVKRGATAGGPYSVIADDIGATGFVDSQVVPHQVCHYVVSATNAAGPSPDSLAVAACAGLPEGWQYQGLGTTGPAGIALFDGSVFTVEAGGTGVGAESDSCQFVCLPASGGSEITARYVPQISSQFTEFGLMLRVSTETGAANAALVIRPGRGRDHDTPEWQVGLMVRSRPEAETLKPAAPLALTAPVVSYDRLTGPCWLKLTRRGSEVTGLISTNGLVWIAVGSASVEMGRSALIGLLFASGLSNQTTTVQMDQVSVK